MNFSRKEIIYAAAWALLIALSTIIPYSIGASFAPPGQHFMGFIGNNLDQNSYTAWMKQAEEGRIFFSGKFTTEAQSGWFFHPFFLACGWFAKLAGLETAAAYHLIRVLLAFLLLLSAYFFSGKFLKGKGQRLFFLVFLSLSSGIGWLFPQGSLLLKENIYAITCADKWITESITFMCLTTKSLFLAATLLMLGVFFFGPEVEARIGRNEFFRFWLTAIVLAGLAWLVSVQFGRGGQAGLLVGASGAVTATLAVFIWNNPHQELLLWGILP
ncbi:MAG: rhomboid family intramembrane serine protease, partial [Candidatus Firestonebacteria bacterium]